MLPQGRGLKNLITLAIQNRKLNRLIAVLLVLTLVKECLDPTDYRRSSEKYQEGDFKMMNKEKLIKELDEVKLV